MCSLIGDAFLHSMDEGIKFEFKNGRGETTLSQMIHIKIITEINEINLPKEETTFHVMKASG